ncbi:MAG: signal peptidase I [Nocardioidaceae bacterium]
MSKSLSHDLAGDPSGAGADPKAVENEAVRGDADQPRRHRLRVVAWLLAVAIAVIVGVFALEPVKIGSQSMAPTLEQGQRVWLDKMTYRWRSPRRGEIVAFHAPDSGTLTVKRVVGIAGDQVAIRDGALWVDDARVHEQYVQHSQVDSVYFGPTTVPAGTVFLMGDNRAESIDSRAFGAIPLSAVVGRVMQLWSG